jgi:uncharacterized membrane protein (UPF0127 family)
MTRRVSEIRTESGSIACARCRLAESFLTRLRGLMFRSSLAPGEGLLFPRARAVHTHFMRFPIDLAFLDADDVVIDVRPALRPWRTASCSQARSVLELAAGDLERGGVTVGTRLVRTSSAHAGVTAA